MVEKMAMVEVLVSDWLKTKWSCSMFGQAATKRSIITEITKASL